MKLGVAVSHDSREKHNVVPLSVNRSTPRQSSSRFPTEDLGHVTLAQSIIR